MGPRLTDALLRYDTYLATRPVTPVQTSPDDAEFEKLRDDARAVDGAGLGSVRMSARWPERVTARRA